MFDELKANKALARDKAVGCICGLAIGDSFGDASRMQGNRENYGITTDFNKGAAWSTDDTEFALLTAKTLIGCDGKLTTQHVIDAWMPLHDALRASTWATTAEAIPAAFACLKMVGDDFKKGVILAGNFARDADTIGAVAGAILGAKFGVGAIPSHWVEKTRFPSGTCLTFIRRK